jgi:hypothetical protein
MTVASLSLRNPIVGSVARMRASSVIWSVPFFNGTL